MGRRESIDEQTAIEVDGHLASKLGLNKIADGGTDQTASGWFPAAIDAMYPKDAGYQLSLLTGFLDRTCYRYAAGDRRATADIVRAILRSEQGGAFLDLVMADAMPAWWRAIQRARRAVAIFDQFRKDANEIDS